MITLVSSQKQYLRKNMQHSGIISHVELFWNGSPLNFSFWSILESPSVEILHQDSMIPNTLSFSELICLYHNAPRYVRIAPFLQIKDTDKNLL